MQKSRFSMTLLGPFHLEGPGGESLGISSKKGIGLLAILATSPNGERTRGWLQGRLWGSRGEVQASASLRRELSNLRKAFERVGVELIEAEGGRIRMKIEFVEVDVLRNGRDGWVRSERAAPDAEFLEGAEIRGEEGFEEWLGQLRRALPVQRIEGRHVGRTPGPGNYGVPDARALVDAFDATVVVALAPVEIRLHEGRISSPARAFTNQLVGQLARLRWLRVVSLQTTSSLDAAIGDRQDDRDAGFIIEQAIVGASDDESAEIRLLRYRSRELVSTERLPLTADATPERTVARLAARLATRIEREEQTRAVRLPKNDLDFRNLIWRGRWHVNRLTLGDSETALALFDRALALSSNSSEALVQKATALCWKKWATRSPREQFRDISDFARRIMLLDPDDCRGYWLAGIAETWLGNPATGIASLRRAIDIDPSFEPAHAQLGATLNLDGQPDEALQILDFALGLSPNDTHLFFRHTEIAFSWLLLRRYDLSIDWADRALLIRPGYWYAQTIKIHALVQSGDSDGASKIGEEFVESHPNFNQDYLEWVPFSDRSWVKRLFDSVEIATGGALGRLPRMQDRRAF